MHWDAIPPNATLTIAPLAEVIGITILADQFLDEFVDRIIRFVDRQSQFVQAA